MATSIDQIAGYLAAFGTKCYRNPQEDELLVSFGMSDGPLTFVIRAQDDGEFVQLAAPMLAKCPEGHPHVGALLRLLAALDYRKRLVKFGWDPRDGEVIAYADILLGDATLTSDQLRMTIGIFLSILDDERARIAAVIAMGSAGPAMAGQPAGGPDTI